MKQINYRKFLFIISICINLNVSILNAQDVIILTNGNEFKSKVDEIDIEFIKYYKWENLTGAKYSISKSEVFMIRYQSGYIEKFQTQKIDGRKNATNNINEVPNLYNNTSRLTFFYNSGSSSIIQSNNLKQDFYLSDLHHNYLDLGIGINKSISKSHCWGILGIIGIQQYNVDKAKFYSSVSSILTSNEFIYNWYTDDNLLITNLGIQGFYMISDNTNQHKLKFLLSLTSSTPADFKNQFSYYDANRSFSNTIYLKSTQSSGLQFETGIKYEHPIYKKLGIEFSFSIAAMPIETTWIGYGLASSSTNSQTYNYGMTIIKSGMGLLIY